MSVKEGNENVGFGLGDKALAPLKSAMKAALSAVFGRRKTERLFCLLCGVIVGIGMRKPSLFKAFNMMRVCPTGGRVLNGGSGVNVNRRLIRVSGIYWSQISSGIGQSPFFPRPLEAMSAVGALRKRSSG